MISGYGSIRGKFHSVTSLSCDNSFDDVITSSSSSLDSAGGCHGYKSVSSSRDSFCQTPTSQNDKENEKTTVQETQQPATAESGPRDNAGESCNRSDETSCGGPVPPPRRSLEREPLTTESDDEMTATTRLMSASSAMTMIQTATSARRARLTRARAVSDSKSA